MTAITHSYNGRQSRVSPMNWNTGVSGRGCGVENFKHLDYPNNYTETFELCTKVQDDKCISSKSSCDAVLNVVAKLFVSREGPPDA